MFSIHHGYCLRTVEAGASVSSPSLRGAIVIRDQRLSRSAAPVLGALG
jgi:hypothetical protein